MTGSASVRASRDRHAPGLGLAIMTSGFIMMSLTDGVAKILAASIAPGEIAWARFLFQGALLLPVVVQRRRELRAAKRRVASLTAGAREPVERLVNNLPLDGRRVRTYRVALEVAPARTQELPAPRARLDVVEARAAPCGRRVCPRRGTAAGRS